MQLPGTQTDLATRYDPQGAMAALLGWYGFLLTSGFADRQPDWLEAQKCQTCSGTGARGYDTSRMRVVTDGARTYEEPTPIPCVACAGQGTDPTRGFDLTTGAPKREADLAPRWRALSGTPLALEIVMVPRQFAKATLHRLKDGRKDCSLSVVPEERWTWQEAHAVGEFTISVKLAVHQGAERGWFDPQPLALGLEEGHRLPLSAKDGMTEGFKILPAGLTEARAFAAAHPQLRPTDPRQDYGEDAWHLIPQWLRDHWAKQPAMDLRSTS